MSWHMKRGTGGSMERGGAEEEGRWGGRGAVGQERGDGAGEGRWGGRGVVGTERGNGEALEKMDVKERSGDDRWEWMGTKGMEVRGMEVIKGNG